MVSHRWYLPLPQLHCKPDADCPNPMLPCCYCLRSEEKKLITAEIINLSLSQPICKRIHLDFKTAVRDITSQRLNKHYHQYQYQYRSIIF